MADGSSSSSSSSAAATSAASSGSTKDKRVAKIDKCFARICDRNGRAGDHASRNVIMAVALELTEELFDHVRLGERTEPASAALIDFMTACQQFVIERLEFERQRFELTADTASSDKQLAKFEAIIDKMVDKLEDLACGGFTDDIGYDYDELRCNKKRDDAEPEADDDDDDDDEPEGEDKKRPRDDESSDDDDEQPSKRATTDTLAIVDTLSFD